MFATNFQKNQKRSERLSNLFCLLMDTFLVTQTKSLAKLIQVKIYIYPKAAYCYREAVTFSTVVFDVHKNVFFLKKNLRKCALAPEVHSRNI